MKNQITSKILKFAFAFMFALLASSCSEDNETLDAAALAKDQINSEISAKGGKSTTVVVETFTVPSEVCAGVATNFCFEAPISTNLQVQQLIAGVWIQVYQISQSTSVNTCVSLTFATADTYQLRYKIGSGGFTQVPVIVVDCSEGCDDANFSYTTSDNQNIIFTYNHGEAFTSVTIVFTFPQVKNSVLNGDGKYVAADGKLYSVNNEKNQTVFTWTGAVSCKSSEAETFEFSFTPDCSAPPANDGKANIWTDTKIVALNGVALVDNLLTPENEGPYSLKGSLDNIVYLGCPIIP